MIIDDIVPHLLTSALTIGVIYGTMKTKLSELDDKIKASANHAERLSSIEGKIDMILNFFKTKLN